jgi:hypothetical protein
MLISFNFLDKRHRSGVAYGERQGTGTGTVRGQEDYLCYNYYRRSSGRREGVFSKDWIHRFTFYSRTGDGYLYRIHDVCLLVHNIINTFLTCTSMRISWHVQKWGKLLHRDFGQKRVDKPRTKQQTTNLTSAGFTRHFVYPNQINLN